jgi:hypothetical protein
MTDPIHTFDSLKSAYLRYFDSPFDLRFEDLVQARRRLLDRDGVLYREPLIEPQPGYVLSGHDVRAATASVLGGVLELPVRALDDHLKKLLADRRLPEMSRISGAVLTVWTRALPIPSGGAGGVQYIATLR